MELCQQDKLPSSVQLPSLRLRKPWLSTAAPSVLPRQLPMPSPLTYKRDRASNISRTLRAIDGANCAAITVFSPGISRLGIGLECS